MAKNHSAQSCCAVGSLQVFRQVNFLNGEALDGFEGLKERAIIEIEVTQII
tara:strand:+ start:133 stop:285 length:153 start_codon:yes stop_codon:yes gene_type:complete